MRKIPKFLDRYHRWLAIGLLLSMLGLGIASMSKDSGIVDEVAHIPAGYSYLKYQDFRLNPEHPPLLKDLAAAPLLFMNLNFPDKHPSWTKDVNGQWESGWNFIYRGGNDADAILFWSRLPILLLAIGLGWAIYRYSLKKFGSQVALLALFLYVFSPEILGHARLVTTDLGAAAFIFAALVTFVNYLERPTRRSLLVATFVMAAAQLAKFSAVLLIPFLGFITLVMIVVKPGKLKQRLVKYGLGFVAVMSGAFVLIWIFYLFHTLNMPLAVQDRLIEDSIMGGWKEVVSDVLIKINHLPTMKALSQYVLGVLMVFNRVSGGNTTYFLGEVTNQSFLWYFPLTFLIKVPIASLALMLAALVYAVKQYWQKYPLRFWYKFKNYARECPFELTAVSFIIFYSYTSITGNLNLGIRHLLPIMPLIFILSAKKVLEILKHNKWFRPVFAALLAFYLYANLTAFPHYIAYFNEFIGGGSNADKYTSDSSVDWGQDLRRLKSYVDKNNIKDIAVDYFGGGEPKYYFCNHVPLAEGEFKSIDKAFDCKDSGFKEWHAQYGLYKGDYMAVSETFLMNDIYWSKLRGDDGYTQLREQKPIAKIGYSIYLYKMR